MKLLLVGDEINRPRSLSQILKKEGYVVDKIADGEIGLEMALLDSYDIIILDWFLPTLNGLTIVEELRLQEVTTPIIFLTAHNRPEDKVIGLDAGADDYLIQPFVPEEFLARLRALSRRTNKEYAACLLEAGELTLDPSKCNVVIGQTNVNLSLKETLLLEILMRNYGHVVTKERIFERLWGTYSGNTFSNVDLYIFYLRKKIGASYIKTVRGVGYYLGE